MHQIRYFLTVAETLNFTRAAEQCHVAQPSLTRAIKKLEAELGGNLFHREGRRTHMTDLGNMMQPLLTRSIESAAAAKEQAESYGRAEIAHLRLGLSKTVEIRTLEGELNELTRVLPELEIQISRGTASEVEYGLENGQIDVALTAKGDSEWERINQWPLYSEEFVAALNCKHHLSGGTALQLSDLENQSIVNRTHCEGSGLFSELLREQNVDAKFTHSVATEGDLEFLVVNDLGVGIVPKSIEFRNGEIVKLPIEDADYRRTLFLLAVAGRQHSKPADLFIKLLRAKDWSLREN